MSLFLQLLMLTLCALHAQTRTWHNVEIAKYPAYMQLLRHTATKPTISLEEALTPMCTR